MDNYSVVKFTVMAMSTRGTGGPFVRVPTDIELRYRDNGDGIEPIGLWIAGDLFTIGSANDRLRTDK